MEGCRGRCLLSLDDEIRSRVTPLMELCPSMFFHRKKNKKGGWIEEIRPIEYISEKLVHLGQATKSSPFYLDLVHVDDGQSAYSCNALWDSITKFGKSGNLKIIPVTGFYGKGIPYQNLIGIIAGEFGNGACLRLSIRDIIRSSLSSDIKKIMELLNLSEQEVDVIIDLQVIREQCPLYEQFIEKLPFIDSWRSISFLAGSFPKDLGFPMKANNTYKIPRIEWIKWKSEILFEDSVLLKSLRYGDYTVQHALFSEPVPFPNVSASIRYTCDDYWIVLRGEALGKKDGFGAAQYPAEAQLIVDKPEFSGEMFSYGDKLIIEKSKNDSHPGNPKQWLMIAINHHITCTVCQLNPELRGVEAKEVLV